MILYYMIYIYIYIYIYRVLFYDVTYIIGKAICAQWWLEGRATTSLLCPTMLWRYYMILILHYMIVHIWVQWNGQHDGSGSTRPLGFLLWMRHCPDGMQCIPHQKRRSMYLLYYMRLYIYIYMILYGYCLRIG